MSLKSRVRNLESKNADPNKNLIFIAFGDGDDVYSQSVNLVGIDVLKGKDSETEEEFERRAYATLAAGRLLEELTEEEIRDAYERGDKRRANEHTITATIGGEDK